MSYTDENCSLNGGAFTLEKEWYVYAKGLQRGPYSWEELWQEARSGLLGSADLVWSEKLSGWTRAEQISGLFPNQAPPPPPVATAVQGANYSAAPVKKGGKGCLIALIVFLVLLLGGGAAVYYFFFYSGDFSLFKSGQNELVGSWYGMEDEEEAYLQFLADGTVNVIVPAEQYWFFTQYRLEEENSITYLVLYDREYDLWERMAEIRFKGKDKISFTDLWDGETVELDQISDQRIEQFIDDFDFIEDVS
jgi:hypothetical protein